MMVDAVHRLRTNVEKIREQYPNKVPVLVYKSPKSKVPDMERNKFLINGDVTMGQFLYIVRKRISLAPEKALFFLIDGKILPTVSSTMAEVYDAHKNESSLLVLNFQEESVFGAKSLT